MVTKTVTIKERVPAALLRPCPGKWRKAGGPATTEDFIVRGDVNGAGLDTCAAQVAKIAAWDKG
ncbi:MAG: hypothetical protein E5X35_11390 [Mesorhizobium sp.]|uniref:Rz1-like lysis system protein LysC n=1 Tax=unclassified Mesorhizobium TaxID=325217 RepID=UPI0011FF010D|nr:MULTISPECIES: hypothetical protein [unclassified Mesorhizobium]TIR33264.1 MAG: hypothetical protein E5X35_11390 [Mesorhizobium sp.]